MRTATKQILPAPGTGRTKANHITICQSLGRLCWAPHLVYARAKGRAVIHRETRGIDLRLTVALTRLRYDILVDDRYGWSTVNAVQ